MKEYPIRFFAPEVRAILEGRKTVTRRVVKPQPVPKQGMVNAAYCGHPNLWLREGPSHPDDPAFEWKCPYGQPGDRLWVRETFGLVANGLATVYRADKGSEEWLIDRWRPSIHMPRNSSRITLEVTGVRVERLQDISGKDACAEGIDLDFHDSWHASNQRAAFRQLWDAINGPSEPTHLRRRRAKGKLVDRPMPTPGANSWEANPWVWVVEFRRVDEARKAA